MDKRLVDLEIRYTYLERALSDLDGVVLDLRAQIDTLRRQVTLIDQMARSEAPETAPAEKPPHY